MSINKAIIQGRLTRDPELRYTNSGTPVSSFTVAWSEKRGDTERKLFLPCVAWKKTAEHVQAWFVKGQELIVEGTLGSRQWEDKNGNKRETIELTVGSVHFCGRKETSKLDTLKDSPAVQFVEEEDDGELPF